MGLLLIGLGLLAGWGIAAWASSPAKSAPPAPGAAGPPKAQVGALVASFPHARWGQVQRVEVDAGGYRYTVGFTDGTAVEVRGQEIT